MYRHYLKMALRGLLRQPVNFLNIGGLSISVSVTFIIVRVLVFEHSFDRYHENAGQIFRVIEQINSQNGQVHWAPTMGFHTEPLKDAIPEIIDLVRFSPSWGEDPHIRAGGKESFEDKSRFYWVDPQVFEVFNYQVVAGNHRGLQKPGTIAISETIALKYFGNDDPLGQVIERNGTINLHGTAGEYMDYLIVAVFEDIPANSHFTFDFLANPLEGELKNDWLYNYVLLDKNSISDYVEIKINQSFNVRHPKAYADGSRLVLQPLTSIHLHSALDYEIQANGSYYTLLGLGVVAVLILLIGIANYLNLSLVITGSRSKELNVRLVNGATRKELFRQLFTESAFHMTLVLLVSAVITFFLTTYLRKWFDLHLIVTGNDNVLITIGFFVMVIFLLSFLDAGFNSRYAFLNSAHDGPRAIDSPVQSILVIIQFSACIFLIVATLTVREQVSHMTGSEMGFEKEQILIVPNRGQGVFKNINILKSKWMENPNVVAVSMLNSFPGRFEWMGYPSVIAEDNEELDLKVLSNRTDLDFVKAMGIKIVEGRDLSPDFPRDSVSSVLINQAAMKLFGWSQPIDKKIKFGASQTERVVVGVMEDYHYRSLHFPVEPVVIVPDSRFKPMIAIRLKATQPEVIEFLEEGWFGIVPDEPFNYAFLNESFDRQYREEMSLQHLFSAFCILAIMISMLGLFALAIHTIHKRVKEISIRKVLGASVFQLFLLLAGQFFKPIILAFIITAPLAWLVLNQWLENFSYRISIPIWVFLFAILSILIISATAISRHTIILLKTNPVDHLRYE